MKNNVVDDHLSFQRLLQLKLHSSFILLPGRHLDCVLITVNIVVLCLHCLVLWIFITVLRHFPQPTTLFVIWMLCSTVSTVCSKCCVHYASGGNSTSDFKWLVVFLLTDFIIFCFDIIIIDYWSQTQDPNATMIREPLHTSVGSVLTVPTNTNIKVNIRKLLACWQLSCLMKEVEPHPEALCVCTVDSDHCPM
jgi:hypothetical protein